MVNQFKSDRNNQTQLFDSTNIKEKIQSLYAEQTCVDAIETFLIDNDSIQPQLNWIFYTPNISNIDFLTLLSYQQSVLDFVDKAIFEDANFYFEVFTLTKSEYEDIRQAKLEKKHTTISYGLMDRFCSFFKRK